MPFRNLCSLLNLRIEEKGNYPYLNAKFLRTKVNSENPMKKNKFIYYYNHINNWFYKTIL